jgi:hypothetical protein
MAGNSECITYASAVNFSQFSARLDFLSNDMPFLRTGLPIALANGTRPAKRRGDHRARCDSQDTLTDTMENAAMKGTWILNNPKSGEFE